MSSFLNTRCSEGTHIWNELPSQLCGLEDFNKFKTRLNHIFSMNILADFFYGSGTIAFCTEQITHIIIINLKETIKKDALATLDIFYNSLFLQLAFVLSTDLLAVRDL